MAISLERRRWHPDSRMHRTLKTLLLLLLIAALPLQGAAAAMRLSCGPAHHHPAGTTGVRHGRASSRCCRGPFRFGPLLHSTPRPVPSRRRLRRTAMHIPTAAHAPLAASAPPPRLPPPFRPLRSRGRSSSPSPPLHCLPDSFQPASNALPEPFSLDRHLMPTVADAVRSPAALEHARELPRVKWHTPKRT